MELGQGKASRWPGTGRRQSEERGAAGGSPSVCGVVGQSVCPTENLLLTDHGPELELLPVWGQAEPEGDDRPLMTGAALGTRQSIVDCSTHEKMINQ